MNEGPARECLAYAYDHVNFDNAEIYAEGKSEEIMVRDKKLGWTRDTYCVSSKVFGWRNPRNSD